MQKRSSVANNQRKVILLRDNTRLHVAKSVKQALLENEWMNKNNERKKKKKFKKIKSSL
ncbi:hypothetical protein ALC57_01666 [Trachymyrmex cornetzi]|uniref:Uncharacterized protein n=1 Tax=Trachymyrmex cornetzi TaxID=471704 RepID=A0A151JPZ0_9HYME|nr:hypothetical protein ALC57_01666 [Trachymyrmex cornetzi]